MDLNNYNLGKYIAYAVNDPKKYPRKPFLHKEEDISIPMTENEMDKIMRKNTITLGGKVKWQ